MPCRESSTRGRHDTTTPAVRGSGEDGVLEAVRGVAVVGAGVWPLEAVRGCWRLLEG